jgi:hypothetical protein
MCVCRAPNCCDTEQRSASQPGSVASGTPYIFNVEIACPFLTNKYIDQFVCVQQKAPDKGPRDVQRSLQELGVQNSEVALPDFLKITDP